MYDTLSSVKSWTSIRFSIKPNASTNLSTFGHQKARKNSCLLNRSYGFDLKDTTKTHELPRFPIGFISGIRFLVNLTSYFVKQSIIQTFDQMRVFHIPWATSCQQKILETFTIQTCINNRENTFVNNKFMFSLKLSSTHDREMLQMPKAIFK